MGKMGLALVGKERKHNVSTFWTLPSSNQRQRQRHCLQDRVPPEEL